MPEAKPFEVWHWVCECGYENQLNGQDQPDDTEQCEDCDLVVQMVI